jgi:hypothetical protein
MIEALSRMVHQGASVDEAVKLLQQ